MAKSRRYACVGMKGAQRNEPGHQDALPPITSALNVVLEIFQNDWELNHAYAALLLSRDAREAGA